MIYPGTVLSCNDNSGALTVKCIGIKNSSKWRGSSAGSLIIITVKTCLKGASKVQKGSIHYGVITWTKQILTWSTKTGDFLRFNENSVVLVSKKNNFLPVGTRVLGPICWEVRKKIFIKVVLLASGIF
jgi:large subunit ribosomal protein L14